MTGRHSVIRSVLSALVLALVAFPIGCGNDSKSTSLAPFQPEIVNVQDNFSFQATGVENVSTTLTYTWQNSGSQATIDHSSVVTDGTASVTIYDTNDSLMYTRGLVASGSEPSAVGQTGAWRIVVTLANCSGTLNFRVQKM